MKRSSFWNGHTADLEDLQMPEPSRYERILTKEGIVPPFFVARARMAEGG